MEYTVSITRVRPNGTLQHITEFTRQDLGRAKYEAAYRSNFGELVTISNALTGQPLWSLNNDRVWVEVK